jgi:hypothetical protein
MSNEVENVKPVGNIDERAMFDEKDESSEETLVKEDNQDGELTLDFDEESSDEDSDNEQDEEVDKDEWSERVQYYLHEYLRAIKNKDSITE